MRDPSRQALAGLALAGLAGLAGLRVVAAQTTPDRIWHQTCLGGGGYRRSPSIEGGGFYSHEVEVNTSDRQRINITSNINVK